MQIALTLEICIHPWISPEDPLDAASVYTEATRWFEMPFPPVPEQEISLEARQIPSAEYSRIWQAMLRGCSASGVLRLRRVMFRESTQRYSAWATELASTPWMLRELTFQYVHQYGFKADTDFFGRAFGNAATAGNLSALRQLIDRQAEATSWKETLELGLWHAAKNGHLSVVQSLVEVGADADTHCSGSFTPLMMAALGGHQEVVSHLVELGADVSLQTIIETGTFTALTMAISSGSAPITRRLIEVGADLAVRSLAGTSLLMRAADFGQFAVTQELIRAGMDVNAQDDNGNTPLIQAVMRSQKTRKTAERRYAEVIQLLLNAGANPSVPNLDGKTALSLTTEQNAQDLIAALRHVEDH